MNVGAVMANGVTVTQGAARFPDRNGEIVKITLGAAWWDGEFDIGTLLDHAAEANGIDIDRDSILPALVAEMDAERPARAELERLHLVEGDQPFGVLASQLLAKPVEDHPYFIPGLIRPGGVTLIGGREKLSGKSTLTSYLMRRLELQEPTIFGDAYSEPVKTIWVTEEPEYSLREKIADFKLESVYIVRMSDWAAQGPGAETFGGKLAIIEAIAVGAGYRHVVIDPLSRIAGIVDEAGTELGIAVDKASQMAQRADLAVTLIHHNNKGIGRQAIDRMRGSTSLTAAVDVIVQIDRGSKKAKRDRPLTALGRVRASDMEKVITLGEDNCSYTIRDREDADEHVGISDLAHLRAGGPTTIAEFAKRLSVSEKVAGERLRELLDDGTAEKSKEGNDKAVYRALAQTETETDSVDIAPDSV
jgi:hypothetical protein